MNKGTNISADVILLNVRNKLEMTDEKFLKGFHIFWKTSNN